VKRIKLQRIHLEEDAGKNTHVGAVSHVDLDRAGVPLVEVVTEPVIGSSEEAAEFMRSLHRLVRWLEISEADMEKGQMRCDANVSVRRRGEDRLGTRTELKNINSFRFVQNAIDHEIARQIRILDAGGRITRETRLWDATLGQSALLRSKEEANDYRYFPDPDLPPLVVDGQIMGRSCAPCPSCPSCVRALPARARDRPRRRAHVDRRPRARRVLRYRRRAHPGDRSGRMIANWMLTELLGALNAEGKSISDSPMPARTLSALVVLVESGTISGKIGKGDLRGELPHR